jgi:hypothetical protein
MTTGVVVVVLLVEFVLFVVVFYPDGVGGIMGIIKSVY